MVATRRAMASTVGENRVSGTSRAVASRKEEVTTRAEEKEGTKERKEKVKEGGKCIQMRAGFAASMVIGETNVG